MADREKVIEGLKRCLHFDGTCNDCPYDGPNCQNDVLDDAIALLKEQEYKDKMFHALEEDWKLLQEQLEIVRCKDCKRKDALSCPKAPVRPDDWFCADGERKTNDA